MGHKRVVLLFRLFVESFPPTPIPPSPQKKHFPTCDTQLHFCTTKMQFLRVGLLLLHHIRFKSSLHIIRRGVSVFCVTFCGQRWTGSRFRYVRNDCLSISISFGKGRRFNSSFHECAFVELFRWFWTVWLTQKTVIVIAKSSEWPSETDFKIENDNKSTLLKWRIESPTFAE